MDYEKAYKEALERARSYYNNEEVRVGMTPIELEEIFPELKENEDGDNKRISKEITRFLKQNNGWNREWLDWLEKQSEQKPAWSEEDEYRINRISDFIWKNRKGDTDEIYQQEQDVNWLKSLKERIGWKPSDEQMDALDSTLQYSQVSHNSYEHLNSLYNDLKKLTE